MGDNGSSLIFPIEKCICQNLRSWARQRLFIHEKKGDYLGHKVNSGNKKKGKRKAREIKKQGEEK